MYLTPALAAAALHVGLTTLIGIVLAMNCGKVRAAAGISIGDGGDPGLIRAMRGQANFTETAPVGLVLLVLVALMGAPSWVVHLLGLMLVLGRALHAVHFIQADAPGWQRGVGAGLTVLMLALGGLGLIGYGVYGVLS